MDEMKDERFCTREKELWISINPPGILPSKKEEMVKKTQIGEIKNQEKKFGVCSYRKKKVLK